MSPRRMRRHPQLSTDEVSDFDESPTFQLLVDGGEMPYEASVCAEVNGILEQELRQLSRTYREVFWLQDVEQLSGAQTAAILGVTIGCVKTRLARARLKLRAYLAPKLGWREEAG